MKMICLLTLATSFGLSLALPAQQPGPDQDRPKDGPPSFRPDQKPESQHRPQGPGPASERGPGPHAGSQDRGPHQHSASHNDREQHIREAIKHLREAGLGDVASRLEHAIAGRSDDRRGHRRDFASRRPMNGPRDGKFHGPGQHHHRWSEQARREGGPFAAPQRTPDGRPDAARGSDQRRDDKPGNAGDDELRSRLDRLTREVEQLKLTMKQQRTPDGPREQVRRPDEPKPDELKREERRDGPPGPSL